MLDNDILRSAVEKFGDNSQCLKAIEEMSELQRELVKYVLGAEDSSAQVAKICEEIADVEIMIAQLRIIFPFDKVILNYKEHKLKRLAGIL